MSKEINSFVAIPSELQIHRLEEQDTVVYSLKTILLFPYFNKLPLTSKIFTIQNGPNGCTGKLSEFCMSRQNFSRQH